MANSEQSYADRKARADLMVAQITAFSPTFAPSDTDLAPDPFGEFVESVGEQNGIVGAHLAAWQNVVQEREDLVKEMKKTATRVLAFLNSNAALAKRLPQAKRAADKLRGMHPKKPAAPEPPEGEPEPKKRNKGDQSYMDIEGHFKALVTAVTGLTGYTPVPEENPITLANLNATLATYRAKNVDLGPLEIAWRDAARDRLELFDGKEGLREKMKAVKNATKAQYGQNSPEYAAVKGIAL